MAMRCQRITAAIRSDVAARNDALLWSHSGLGGARGGAPGDLHRRG
jgi:hypothetical protein